MVRIHPDPPPCQAAGTRVSRPLRVEGQQNGAVAQLGERLLCKQEAVGSIPSGSTRLAGKPVGCVCQRFALCLGARSAKPNAVVL